MQRSRVDYETLSFKGWQDTYGLDAKVRVLVERRPNGGVAYRCPPGTPGGGNFTDRTGRTCAVGMVRRGLRAFIHGAERADNALASRQRRRAARPPLRARAAGRVREQAGRLNRIADRIELGPQQRERGPGRVRRLVGNAAGGAASNLERSRRPNRVRRAVGNAAGGFASRLEGDAVPERRRGRVRRAVGNAAGGAASRLEDREPGAIRRRLGNAAGGLASRIEPEDVRRIPANRVRIEPKPRPEVDLPRPRQAVRKPPVKKPAARKPAGRAAEAAAERAGGRARQAAPKLVKPGVFAEAKLKLNDVGKRRVLVVANGMKRILETHLKQQMERAGLDGNNYRKLVPIAKRAGWADADRIAADVHDFEVLKSVRSGNLEALDGLKKSSRRRQRLAALVAHEEGRGPIKLSPTRRSAKPPVRTPKPASPLEARKAPAVPLVERIRKILKDAVDVGPNGRNDFGDEGLERLLKWVADRHPEAREVDAIGNGGPQWMKDRIDELNDDEVRQLLDVANGITGDWKKPKQPAPNVARLLSSEERAARAKPPKRSPKPKRTRESAAPKRSIRFEPAPGIDIDFKNVLFGKVRKPKDRLIDRQGEPDADGVFHAKAVPLDANPAIKNQADAIQWVADGGALSLVPDEYIRAALFENADQVGGKLGWGKDPKKPINGVDQFGNTVETQIRRSLRSPGDVFVAPGVEIPDIYKNEPRVKVARPGDRPQLKRFVMKGNISISSPTLFFARDADGNPTAQGFIFKPIDPHFKQANFAELLGVEIQQELGIPGAAGRRNGGDNIILELAGAVLEGDGPEGNDFDGGRVSPKSRLLHGALNFALGAADRHGGNGLVVKGPDGQRHAIPIDFGRAFINQMSEDFATYLRREFKMDFRMLIDLQEHFDRLTPEQRKIEKAEFRQVMETFISRGRSVHQRWDLMVDRIKDNADGVGGSDIIRNFNLSFGRRLDNLESQLDTLLDTLFGA